MSIDRFGGEHSSSDHTSVAAFEDAVLGIVAHQPMVTAALERALAADRCLTAGHALKGLAAIILAREELLSSARLALTDAKVALAFGGKGTASERTLVEALAEAVDGR